MQLNPDDEAYIGNEDRLIRESLIASNAAFCKAMMKQIKRGSERVVVGTKVDTSPCTVRRIQPEPVFSGIGSPGALCADKGDTDPKEIVSYV